MESRFWQLALERRAIGATCMSLALWDGLPLCQSRFLREPGCHGWVKTQPEGPVALRRRLSPGLPFREATL